MSHCALFVLYAAIVCGCFFSLVFSLCRLCRVAILHFVMRVRRMCPDYVKLSVQNASIQVRIF